MAPGSTGLLWLDNYSTPIPRRDPFVSSPLGSGAVGEYTATAGDGDNFA